MKVNLKNLVSYHDYQISSRSLSKKLELDKTITIYAMAKDESISNESSLQIKLLQILDGQLQLKMDGKEELLVEGDLLTIPAQTVHSIFAIERCQFLQLEL